MRKPRGHGTSVGCPVEITLEIIGGKWKGVIVYYLLERTKRFNELRRLLPNVTQRMLTLQLRELEKSKIIERKIYPEIPPKVEYSVTDLGKTLAPIISAMRTWGISYKKHKLSSSIGSSI